MNKSALYKLLKAADNADGDVYAPSAFTYEAYLELEQRIQVVQREIEPIIGRELELEGGVQDASYMESLNVYRNVVTPDHSGTSLEIEFNIIFSNFSNFVAIGGDYKFKSISYPVEEVVEVLESHDFIYIPPEILGEKYMGRHEAFLGSTWAHRFFSYI